MLGHGAIVDGKKYMRLDAHKLMLEGAAEREEALQAENQRLREALYPYLPEHDIAYSSSRGFALGTRCPCTDCLNARAALAKGMT